MLSGTSFQTWILGLIGSVAISFGAFKLVQHYVQSAWGEFITAIAGLAVVVGFATAPTQSMKVLTFIWNKITGLG